MEDKILSIIVPSYNMEAYLPKCLGSLIVDDKELFQKLDVIVVNDGSKDRTGEIAHSYAARYPGVFRVEDKTNGNYGSCINAALPIAKGVFVKILDADDSFDTEAFIKMLTVMKESEFDAEQVDLFLTDFVEVDETGSEKVLRSVQLPPNRTMKVDDVDRIPLLYMHSIAYRTESLWRMQYRQTEGISYTDTEWTYYPMRKVARLRYEKLTVYRYLVGRAGQTMAPEVLKQSIWVFAGIAQRMVEDFCLQMPDVSQAIGRYLEEFVVMMNAKVYNMGILSIHDNDDDKTLVAFDESLESKSEYLHKKVMDRLVSHKIGFKYGRYWKKHKSSNTPRLLLFRVYLQLTAYILTLFCTRNKK